MKFSKTAVHNAIMQYQNEGVFIDRKRPGRPMVTTSKEDHLRRTHSPMSTFKKIQAKLMEIGTAVSRKTLQRRSSLEFGLKSFKPARKPRLTHAMKKKRLDFTKRHASWNIDVEIETFSVNKNTLILVFHDRIVHSCFAKLHFLRDLTYKNTLNC